MNALVRAYCLGQRQMYELAFVEMRLTGIAPLARFGVIEAITATLFVYIDWISQQVVAVYEDERERWVENQNSVRAIRVREALAGKAAEELNLHSNSVKYRAGRAVARRGRAIDVDRLDVEVALLVCHRYGAGVLQQVPAVPERREPS